MSARRIPLHPILAFALTVATGFTSSSCGILIGSQKPVTEHSRHFTIVPPSKNDPDWTPIVDAPKAEADDDGADPDHSEFAWQSKKTAATISLNSACRERFKKDETDLQEFTGQLLLGISDIRDRTERAITVSSLPAIETTLTGRVEERLTRIQVVVVKKSNCVYDLMYVSRPKHFESSLPAFTQFISTFQIE
jgi:hypothetical protein